MENEFFLPAEWMPQSGIIITWPEQHTDWSNMLDAVSECYHAIAREIALREKLVIVCKVKDNIRERFEKKLLQNIIFIEADYNDTWVRDYGPIAIIKYSQPVLLNFGFNGWGLKYASHLDNQLTKFLYKKDIFHNSVHLVNRKDLILEGGSIESDGNGTLLVTQSCLLSPNRNEHFSKIEIEEELKQSFAVERVLWLKHGYLAGDDTDGHIDMLTRYINEKSIMYLKCDDNNDEHYHELTRMEDELKQFKTLDGSYYELIPVPLPKAIYDSDGRRLPATYLNFLIINGAVLLPVYNNEADNMAIDIFKKHFREREVIPVNCLPLLNENGSLHCATMQLPEGCL